MSTELDCLLLQHVKLNIAIRKDYQAAKRRDPEAKFFTYVLQLQDNKYYVGTTDNIYQRLLDHTLMTPMSAIWVRHHGPVQRVLEVSRNSSKADEAYKTLQYMDMFGWDNVRGGGYCKLQRFGPPEALKTFERDRDHEFEYLTRAEIDAVLAAIKDLSDTYAAVCTDANI